MEFLIPPKHYRSDCNICSSVFFSEISLTVMPNLSSSERKTRNFCQVETIFFSLPELFCVLGMDLQPVPFHFPSYDASLLATSFSPRFLSTKHFQFISYKFCLSLVSFSLLPDYFALSFSPYPSNIVCSVVKFLCSSQLFFMVSLLDLYIFFFFLNFLFVVSLAQFCGSVYSSQNLCEDEGNR